MKYTIKESEKSNQATRRFAKKSRLVPLLGMLLTILLGLYSCTSKESLTKRLFMQSKRANLELPADRVDSTGQAILREEVSYQNEDNSSEFVAGQDSIQRVQKSLSEVQKLNEVMITAKVKQKFAPERDGKVDVNFMIRVPKELLSSDWRVSLFPKLLHNDSIVALKQVILKGENFLAKEKNDSLNFVDYEASIIPQSAYDSLFLDRKGIAKDLFKRQNHYWQLYDKEVKKVMAYQNWKYNTLDRYAAFNVKKDGNRLNLYHKYMRAKQEESIRLLTVGIDTTNINQKYEHKFRKRAKLLPQYHMQRELTLQKVPKKYKHFFLTEPDLENISNHTTTEEDSIQIAKHRYFFDQIAENELKDNRRDEIRDRMIPFSKEQNVELDSIVNATEDFIFYYKQQYPVTPGLAKIRIAMSGQVIATDQSSYTLPKADTLHYVISSLSQLVDTSLIVKTTKLYRNMYDRMTIYPQFEPNKSSFSIGYQNNRQEVDTLINQYKKLTQGMSLHMDSLELKAWSSLDGSYDSNYNLSQKRAESLSDYLQNNFSDLIGYNTLKITPKGEDWQGFVNEIKKRDDIVSKDSIFAMVQRTTFPDKTEEEIRYRYKADYKIIKEVVYPKLRRMDITFYLSRPEMTVNDTIMQEVKNGYEEGLRLLQDRQYYKALEILKDYPDYNAALCLVCMGYNGKAYDILVKLPQTANIEYLLAIVSQRLDKDQEAVEHLLKAVELEPNKAYRIIQDSEVTALVNKYNLQGQIDDIQDNFDEPEQESEEQQSEDVSTDKEDVSEATQQEEDTSSQAEEASSEEAQTEEASEEE